MGSKIIMQLRGQRQTLLLERRVLPDHRAFRRSERKRGQTAPRELGFEHPIRSYHLLITSEASIRPDINARHLREQLHNIRPPSRSKSVQHDLSGFTSKDDEPCTDIQHDRIAI